MLKGSLDTFEGEGGNLERSYDDPRGAHGCRHRRGSPDRYPAAFLARAVHATSAGGRPLRAAARLAPRGAGDGSLPTRRGRWRARVRPVLRRARQDRRTYRRVTPLLFTWLPRGPPPPPPPGQIPPRERGGGFVFFGGCCPSFYFRHLGLLALR